MRTRLSCNGLSGRSTVADFAPRDYQQQAIAHVVAKRRCALFLPMGSGKTGAVLCALDALSLAERPFPVLVVAPLRVAQSTWPDETQKWDNFKHLRVAPIVGDVRQRKAALNSGADIHTINFENLPWLVETVGATWPWQTVVVDEQTKLKGFRTRQGSTRARALAKVAHAKVDRWIGLTGTPAPNGLVDLWGPTYFIDKGERLGRSFTAFSERWFTTDWTGYGLTPLPHAQREVEAALADVCLTVTGLPVDEPVVNTIRVDLPAKARQIYRGMEKEFYAILSATTEVEAFNAAVKSQKLLQLACGFIYDDDRKPHYVHDAKLDALDSVIEEAAGAPVLVAYHFRADLERLRRAYPKARELDSDPGTIRDWNAGKIPVLFAHPASAGHGLNLQDGGNILVFYSVDWNLEHHDQIIERIGPMRQKQAGHDRPVFLHYLLAGDTIDEVVVDRLRNKREIQAVLMEAMRRKT
jgi:SNF2 family DNA or RNA helicase